MAKKNLGTATLVTSALRTNTVLVEIGGSIRRITIDNLMNVINTGDEQLLRQVAWGVPCKQNQTSQAWGVIGNVGMFAEYASMVGRYLVTNDGKAAKLSATNSGVFADGTTLDESKGHVMVIAPRLYYVGKTESASGVTYAWFSMLPIGGKYLGNCHNDEYICMGAYLGSVVNNALVSRSGLTPTASHTIDWFWNAAQINGKSWGIINNDHCKFLLYMGLSKYGNPNIQSQLGYGVGGSTEMGWDYFVASATNLKTGATKSLGDACGSIPLTQISADVAAGTNASRVNLFGVEDWYNWFWQFVQGVYFGNSSNAAQNGSEIYIYEGNRMPTAAELTTHPVGNYRQLQRVTASGWIRELILGENLDIFCKLTGGGSTSYWGDYFWTNTTGQVLLWGGSANYGSHCGLACATSVGAWSYSYSDIGSRLAYYGQLTFMSGKELAASVA